MNRQGCFLLPVLLPESLFRRQTFPNVSFGNMKIYNENNMAFGGRYLSILHVSSFWLLTFLLKWYILLNTNRRTGSFCQAGQKSRVSGKN